MGECRPTPAQDNAYACVVLCRAASGAEVELYLVMQGGPEGQIAVVPLLRVTLVPAGAAASRLFASDESDPVSGFSDQ